MGIKFHEVNRIFQDIGWYVNFQHRRAQDIS